MKRKRKVRTSGRETKEYVEEMLGGNIKKNARSIKKVEKQVGDIADSIKSLTDVVKDLATKNMTDAEKADQQREMLEKEVEKNPAIGFLVQQFADLKKQFTGEDDDEHRRGGQEGEEGSAESAIRVIDPPGREQSQRSMGVTIITAISRSF